MVPADSDVAFSVEARAESDFHVVRNEAAARSHKRAVSKFAACLFIPENNIGKSKNLMVKKINGSDVRADIEQKHY